jgi:hypothetical protein
MAPADLTKRLVMPIIYTYVWFVANFLAANGLVGVPFTDCSQNFGKPWALESSAKYLADQFW